MWCDTNQSIRRPEQHILFCDEVETAGVALYLPLETLKVHLSQLDQFWLDF